MSYKENQNLPVWMNQLTPNLLRQMCVQLNKDLNRAGILEHIENVADPIIMKNELEAVLEKYLTADSKKINNLLYAVDVPETELKTYLSTQKEALGAALTWLILKRTWQKISFRLSNF